MRRTGLHIIVAIVAGIAGAALAADAVAPPGTRQILEASADGVQIYACEARDGKLGWIFRAPEAALFDARGRQIGTHGRGPTWTLTDGSSVTAELVAKEPAPEKGAIPWLLLSVKSHEGAGSLTPAAYVLRIDTKGGVEPSEPCVTGEVARIRYSATYRFLAR